MGEQKIKILLIEDDAAVAQVIAAIFRKATDFSVEVEFAGTLQQGEECLRKKEVDAVFLDLTLPDSWGLETVAKVQLLAPDLPIIVLTGIDDEAMATNAVRAGAQDYIVKGHLDAGMLVRSVRYAIERKHAEEALRRARDELEVRVEERTIELRQANESLREEVEERKHAEQELRIAHTKLKETQAQLVQAAKMQVVGGLASGVAHEVKNPLAIILQGVEYLEKKIPREEPNVTLTLGYIRNAVERADTIVRGLMDFASISQLNISMQSLAPVLEKALMLLKHQFDKQHILLNKEIDGEIPEIAIDRNKIEQVFLNLLMNATEAMAQGGNLSVKVFSLSGGKARELLPRRDNDEPDINVCVVVEIEDSGPGIPADMLDRIFDPFFTTKRTQGGTGLGLAIVRNILEMHGARIAVTLRNEGGTRVRVLFPVYKQGGA
ncbi:MAG: ATP-binding protein [Candidatus Omnitrophica bacterium]|nr:ATP-binding protein [Candidatus Omnitrophota bacterium]